MLRRKLAGLIDRAFSARTEQLRDELIQAFDERLKAVRDEIVAATTALEIRQRRDLFFAGEVQSASESAAFAMQHMVGVRCFPHPHDTLRYALELVSVDGLALEFGVASGTTLRLITAGLPAHKAFGFDTFTGLPEAWRPGFPAGAFAQESLPDVPGAELVVGLFADTLPGFLEANPGPIAFLHVDADLYSAARDVLSLLRERIVAGTVIVFDEYFNHPGWQTGEFQAWAEFVEATGFTFEYRAYTYDNEQVVVVVGARAEQADRREGHRSSAQ